MAKIIEGTALIVGALVLEFVPGLQGLALVLGKFGVAVLAAAVSAGTSLLLAGIAEALQHDVGTGIALRQAAAPQTVVYGRVVIGGALVWTESAPVVSG